MSVPRPCRSIPPMPHTRRSAVRGDAEALRTSSSSRRFGTGEGMAEMDRMLQRPGGRTSGNARENGGDDLIAVTLAEHERLRRGGAGSIEKILLNRVTGSRQPR